jgi:hypothetical protein
MAVSAIAGDVGGGLKLPCILYEGQPTVTDDALGPDGYTDTAITFASPLKKDDFVVPDVQTENTFIATNGVPVAKAIAAGTLIVGRIITTPQLVRAPANTAAGNTWAKQLAGQYYRVATVEWFGLSGAIKAVVKGLNAAAIVPGVAGTMKIDASESIALQGGVTTLAVSDVANGGVGLISFHYIPAAAADVSALVSFVGGTVVIQG